MRGEMRVLILDEPTASLTDRETDICSALSPRLKARGIGIVYISHRIHEFERSPTASPFCATAAIAALFRPRALSEERLLALMTGRAMGAIYPAIARPGGPEVLQVENLVAAGVHGASFARSVPAR